MFRLVSSPREGWLSLILLSAVVLSPALSLSSAEWVDDLWIVPWLAFFSLLMGTVLAKLPVRGRVAHPFALVIGLGLVGTYFAAVPGFRDWEERFAWLGGRVWAWLQVVFGGGMSNDSMLFALIMAITAWLLGYLSGWFAFRNHSVWPSLLACGSGLLVNLSYGAPNPLEYFLVFLLASMLLLVRVTLFQKERDWHQVDADYNRSLTWSFLWRSGLLSAGIVAMAWMMPTGTVNASVADTWYNVTGPWQGLQVEFDRVFASVGSSTGKVEGNRFSKTLALKGAIELGSDLVMLVSSPKAEYWAAQTYDRYTGQGWMSSAVQTTRLSANDDQLAATSMYQGRGDLEQRFKLLVGRSATIFAATSPVKLSLPVYADHFDTLDELAGVRSTVTLRQGQQYAVISSVSTASASELRKAGTDYPAWTARYLELPYGPDLRRVNQAGRRVVALARRVTREADNPYDAAIALQDYLRQFRYEIKVASPPPDRDAVDWFLFTSKEGYCDYFASAMAVMARSLGIPSRVVSGYNTGTLNQETGLYEVRQENAHSWPELFFPGYGWVSFEPTPSQPVPERPEAPPAESTSSAGDPSESDLEALSLDVAGRDKMLLDDEQLDMAGGGSYAGDVVQRTVEWSLAILPIALLACMLLLVLLWRRLVSHLSAAGRAYLQMYWIAGLLGWRLRPSFTPVEYGRMICAATPQLDPEVRAVVDSYVEETYGSGRSAADQTARGSWDRIRWRLPAALLRVAISRQISGFRH